MRVIKLFLTILLLSNFSYAKVTCNSVYSLSDEAKVEKTILDPQISPNITFSKVRKLVINSLKKRQIDYKTIKLFDHETVVIITPASNSKLGRFARYLEKNFQTQLGFSLELTGKIDAALDIEDQGILLTSIQDILRGDIGAGTRHELAHLWEANALDLDIAHPVFNANLSSKSHLFSSKNMDSYQNFISFGEIHAYSRELHYSLWKLRHTKDLKFKEKIQIDISEAQSKLIEITQLILEKTRYIKKNYKQFKIQKYEHLFEIQHQDWKLELPRTQKNVSEQLDFILEYLSNFQQKLETTAFSDVEAMLREYLKNIK